MRAGGGRMTAAGPSPDVGGQDRPHSQSDENLDAGQDNGGEAAYRVLIVEDDRSQALFAQSVLQGSGMWTCLVSTAAEVKPAIEEFAPDLVLMDLHLPDASGAELTARLREDPALAHLPIVFLTGDPDPETEYRALDAGADDFLSKPIRPRHLVSAVQSRVRRARLARGRQVDDGDGRDPNTGLLRRDRVLPSLHRAKAALLVEIQNTAALQERFGYTGLEQLVRGAGRRLAMLVSGAAARLNDNSFVVLADANQADEGGRGSALEALARRLRDGLGQPIDHDGQPLRLRSAVGWARLADTPAATEPLQALDRALKLARASPAGIAGFEPAAPADAEAEAVAELQAALRERRLELAFQPIVSVEGHDESQFQVLLRLRDADGALHSAGGMLAAAAGSEVLAEVDHWVLEQALARLGADEAPERLFVSQSQQALAADPAGHALRKLLKKRKLAPERLVIDLRLDDALVHNLAYAEFCQAGQAAGVRFCLSQYQHRPEAAALLHQLPLAYLRLTHRYAHLEDDPTLRDELRELIQAAHGAQLKVIGAQVESPSAAAALWMGGVDYIQGNLVQGAGQALDFDFQHSVL